MSGQVVEVEPDDDDEVPDDEEDPDEDDELEELVLHVEDWRARTAAASVGQPVAMQSVACLLAYLLGLGHLRDSHC